MSSNLEEMRDRLNAVSPSFCLAKWSHVTIHLQNGHTHSCHHPATHHVPLAELAENPSALHNTQFKKQRRQEMLSGIRPAECQYCWNVEDAAPGNVSDRTIKSNEPWAAPSFEEARTAPWDANVTPTYVEVSFSNVCNLKCSYCDPRDSSKWAEEIKQFGAYPTSTRFNDPKHLTKAKSHPIPERETNPYVEAFWKWWPVLLPKLKVFRVTGGEPLLSKHTMRVLKWIIEHPQPDLHLAINSNLVVPDELYDKFLDLVLKVVQGGCVKKFELYTSVDAHGARADYIRNGLDYEIWLANVRKFFEIVPDQRLIIMCAFNALSVTSFSRLYADVVELRKAYPDKRSGAAPEGRIEIDLPYLRYPEHQSVMLLPPDYGDRVDDIIAEVKRTPESTQMELIKLTRIRSLMRTPWPEKKLRVTRTDFFRFFSEHDRRRDTKFLETFPEMADFWETCRELAEPNFWESPGRNLWFKAFPPVRG
jgi:organic radical activating enzyme